MLAAPCVCMPQGKLCHHDVQVEYGDTASFCNSAAAALLTMMLRPGSDVQRALESKEITTDPQESTSARRNAMKGEFMAAQFESKAAGTDRGDQVKNKNQFAIIAGLGFFVIPLLFVAVAIWSGYLSSLGGPGSQF